MDIKVRPWREFTESSVISASSDGDNSGTTALDLSGATFVDPFGLVAIAVVAEQAIESGTAVTFRPPINSDIARYLARMRVYECLDSIGIDCAKPAVTEWDTGDRILELRRFDRGNESNDLAEQVYRILAADDADDANTLFSCVAEAVDNVVEHSGASGGWCALQQYTKKGEKYVSFAVGDGGMGLRASLAHAVTISSDEDAIQQATARGVSGTGDATRGQGLHGIVVKARERRGRVRLWSGSASGQTTANSVTPLTVRSHPSHLQGTIVCATLGYTALSGR